MPQIVSSIESGIDQLPDAEKDLIRALVTSAINSWRPPPRKNITSEEEKALRDLAKDKSVTILPADKGRAVVVMNTNHYTEKVNNLLNDDKTYQKITGTQHRAPKNDKNPSINFFYRLKISQPHRTVTKNSWNRSSTTNYIAPTLHRHHFMAFPKSTKITFR